MPKKYLVTGSAGFIGFHISKLLLERGDLVAGIDAFNDYYDPKLKEDRNKILERSANFKLYRSDIADYPSLEGVFEAEKFEAVCHLAAQAGVRYSLENPWAYERANLLGTMNVFEAAKRHGVKKVVFASSSSVYGGNEKLPFCESDSADKPISLYAATKKADELMAYTYRHLYGIEMVGLRFFTVYGPWGRPDMALYKFAQLIRAGKPIDIYNHGKMKRDFTYIDDIAKGICSALDNSFSYEIFNLGNDNPEDLETLISLLEEGLGLSAEKNYMPIQPGDVRSTWADISKARELLGYEPEIGIKEGVNRFSLWYKEYYGLS